LAPQDPIEALSDEINYWVKKATNGMVDRIVGPNDLRDRHLAVLNAVYFFGTWQMPFEATRTKEGDFTQDTGKKVRLADAAKIQNRLGDRKRGRRAEGSGHASFRPTERFQSFGREGGHLCHDGSSPCRRES
jgi:hypothetical protein